MLVMWAAHSGSELGSKGTRQRVGKEHVGVLESHTQLHSRESVTFETEPLCFA